MARATGDIGSDVVSAIPFSLRAELPDTALVDELVTGGARRVGLAGLLAERGSRAWRAWVRGSAAGAGYRWRMRDNHDRTWWPQGIDVAEVDGRRVLVVSWYAQVKDGVSMGVRLTFVDLRNRWWPTYHHVLLVDAVQNRAGNVRLDPIEVHAGGIGWTGDNILVADTFGGLRVFRLDDLLRLDGGPFGYRHVLPQFSRYRSVQAEGTRRMRYSFVSIEHSDGDPRLVAGEYGNDGLGDRLTRIALDADGAVAVDEAGTATPLELHEPGIYRMQGVCVVDGTWYVTTSNGEFTGGDLWVGQPATSTPGDFARHKHVLPAGPEDLAYDRTAKLLWSLSEWPGRRRVFMIDPDRIPRLGRPPRSPESAGPRTPGA
ncbi:hypothetical protein BH11ACT3_BH11ACT3_09070 [soil metagenome]